MDLVPRLSLGIDDTATEQTEARDEGVFGNTNSCTAQRWKSYARTLAVGLDAVAFTVRMASKLLTRKCLKNTYSDGWKIKMHLACAHTSSRIQKLRSTTWSHPFLH